MRIYDFEARVEIDGEPLDEYDVTVAQDGLSASCWIPSEESKAFQVRWKDCHRDRQATRGYLTIDGFRLPGGNIIYPSHGPLSRQNYDTCRSRLRVTDTEYRCLKFSPIELTDDDSVTIDEPTEQLGEIKLDIYDIEIVRDKQDPYRHRPRRPESFRKYTVPPEARRLHETSKKAGGHRVQFGEINQSATPSSSSRPRGGMHIVNVSRMPTFTFTFRYRPLEILKANGVAPPSARPRVRVMPPPPRFSSSTTIKDEVEIFEALVGPEERCRSETKSAPRQPTTDAEPLRITYEMISDDRGVSAPCEVIDLT